MAINVREHNFRSILSHIANRYIPRLSNNSNLKVNVQKKHYSDKSASQCPTDKHEQIEQNMFGEFILWPYLVQPPPIGLFANSPSFATPSSGYPRGRGGCHRGVFSSVMTLATSPATVLVKVWLSPGWGLWRRCRGCRRAGTGRHHYRVWNVENWVK